MADPNVSAREKAIIVSSIVSGCFTIISIFFLVRFICKNCNVQNKPNRHSKCLFWLGILFIVTSFISLLSLTVYTTLESLKLAGVISYHPEDWDWDWSDEVQSQAVPILAVSYLAQIYLIWIINAYRIRYLMNKSKCLSSCCCGCAVYTFISIFFYSFLCVFGYLYVMTDGRNNESQFSAQMMFSINAISLLFAALFTCKLSRTAKLRGLRRNVLMKIVLLSLTSFSVSLTVHGIVYFVSKPEDQWEYWNAYILLTCIPADIFFNFVCVLLTYSVYDTEYRCLCGCIDKRCKKCLFKADVMPINVNSTMYATVTNNNRKGTALEPWVELRESSINSKDVSHYHTI